MSSIFSKIIKGDIPCYKIGENEHFFAFLDINPMSIGHTLVVPKKEVDYVFDLDSESYQGLMAYSKLVAHAIEKEVDCLRIGLMVFGLEVPHAHVHLIPIYKPSDMDVSAAKLNLPTETFIDLASRISRHLT